MAGHAQGNRDHLSKGKVEKCRSTASISIRLDASCVIALDHAGIKGTFGNQGGGVTLGDILAKVNEIADEET
ncbi:MAG: hypothetical protein Q7T55_05765, partial [Solirubrobacteraceae bacterium]|nr:hypothetical protein [Solirubrobacteraceae bacterium]